MLHLPRALCPLCPSTPCDTRDSDPDPGPGASHPARAFTRVRRRRFLYLSLNGAMHRMSDGTLHVTLE